VQYVFHPLAGFATLPKGQSLAFELNNIEVNRTPGSFLVQITEGSSDCQPPDCPVFSTYLTKFPNGWGQVSFWANPTNLPYQGNTTLNWAGSAGRNLHDRLPVEWAGGQRPSTGEAAARESGKVSRRAGSAVVARRHWNRVLARRITGVRWHCWRQCSLRDRYGRVESTSLPSASAHGQSLSPSLRTAVRVFVLSQSFPDNAMWLFLPAATGGTG
jgi:hypothetical protein